MVNYEAVTAAICKHTDWKCFQANFEDGYAAYLNDSYKDWAIVFADWDIVHPDLEKAHIRLDNRREPYQTATKIKVSLNDLDDTAAATAVDDFFEQVEAYLG